MQQDLNGERSYYYSVEQQIRGSSRVLHHSKESNHAISAATQEMRVPLGKRKGQSKGVKFPISHVRASMGLRLLGSILKARSVKAERADLSTALPRHVVSLVVNHR